MASSPRPIQDIIHQEEEKKTLKRSRKRSSIQLSPAPPAVKKQKIQESASTRDLRDGSPSSSSTAVSAGAVLCQATSALTHEMVQKDVWCAELLDLLGEFLCRRCRRLRDLTPEVSTTWLRTVDMLLVVTRRQWKPFLCPGSVVFLYMLCRDSISAEVSSEDEMCAELLTCFYVACSYIGTKLGYPAHHFMLERNRQDFWKRTLDITTRMSHKMLLINISSQLFTQVLSDLKNRTDR
ncbi:cyclin-dependent kinase 5 activator 1-like [Astyanax mexicanus]|uniref:cyclin-dependent kinase 5 activator 1-like n=1 Tax=Astyanax mexicanus TaxID=7994 RepID=UPI0020CADD8A|nr:cyclin-dependent kinase 5 activator 1-like [Astyanax mexicanus]